MTRSHNNSTRENKINSTRDVDDDASSTTTDTNNESENKNHRKANKNSADTSSTFNPKNQMTSTEHVDENDFTGRLSIGTRTNSNSEGNNINGTDIGSQHDQENHKEENNNTTKYTIFTKNEMWMICVAAATFGFFSAISSSVYAPAIPTLKKQFHVSTELINLTIVAYSIFQGLSPSVFASFADSFGRRPVVAVCYTIYIVANIGLARTNVYWLLFVLRCLQATGIASAISIGAGIIGDITTRSNRGTYMSIFSGITIIAVAFGPLMGGALSNNLGWRSIFWFLCISSGCFYIFSIFVLPETKRAIVGNGSIKPKHWWCRAPIMYISRFRNRTSFSNPNFIPDYDSLDPPRKLNIFMPFLLLTNLQIVFVLVPVSLYNAGWTMAITQTSTLLSTNYNYNTLQVGLCYIASGMGSLIGSVSAGPVLDRYYKKCKDIHIIELNKYKQLADIEKQGVEEPFFNIYKARLMMNIFPSILVSLSFILLGWTIEYKVHISVPLIALFLSSFGVCYFMSTTSTLLVDLYPQSSSSASATYNLSRCLMVAVGVAVVDKMCSSLGSGGAFTLIAGICFLSVGLIYWQIWIAPKWDSDAKKKSNLNENSHAHDGLK